MRGWTVRIYSPHEPDTLAAIGRYWRQRNCADTIDEAGCGMACCNAPMAAVRDQWMEFRRCAAAPLWHSSSMICRAKRHGIRVEPEGFEVGPGILPPLVRQGATWGKYRPLSPIDCGNQKRTGQPDELLPIC